MNHPLVSVAIPAYKANYLSESLLSVISQTCEDWELIIVDDCSPYNIKDIVAKHDDSRIHYYRNEKNFGAKDPANNWNKCLEYAKGEYFCLLCDDDIYEPTFLEEMLKLAATYSKCNVFRSRVKIIDGADQVIGFYPSSPAWESCEDYMWHVGHFKRKQTISEWMFRTDHIKKCGGYVNFPYAWGADYASIYRFSLEGGIVSTTQLLVAYRKNNQAISSNIDKNGEEKLCANYLCKQMIMSIIKDNQFSSHLVELMSKRKIKDDRSIISRMRFVDVVKVFIKRKDYDICFSQIMSALLWGISLKVLHHSG